MFFFGVGGLEALLIRLQLATPDGTVLGADTYNRVFTMHGLTMVFMVIMPLAAAFANYLLPLQIGARDVAFPRLNALSYWVFLAGGLFLNMSWLLGDAPDGGWFAYAPNTGVIFSPGHGMDYYVLGLLIMGIASLVSAMNLIVTVLNMRAPGMTLFKMPVMTWMILVVQFLLLFAVPVITVALFLLMFDRNFGANFFNPEMGADPLLWQHLFWIFGHPEVYVLILPSVRHHLRGHPDLLPQAPLRLPVHGLLGDRYRVHGLGGVGPPHVRDGHRSHLGGRLLDCPQCSSRCPPG